MTKLNGKMSKILVTRRTFPASAEKLRASGAEIVIWEDDISPPHDEFVAAVADVDGDLVGVSRQWLVVAPRGVRVARNRLGE